MPRTHEPFQRIQSMRCLLAWVLCVTFLFPTQVQAHRTALPQLNAAAAILIDADTGSVIHQHHAHQHHYPASLTKLMTALLLLEHVPELDNTRIYHSVEAVFSIPRRTSNIAMNDGETLSARHALYAIMLASANEVSNAIAEHVAGDMSHFATLMTQRAHELGAVNTRFVNAHGLHHEDHQTTAYDLSLIMNELLKHPAFLQAISTRGFSIPPTERQPLDRMMNNSHRMIHPHDQRFNPQVVGGKTGFHNEAQHTLVTYARSEDTGLIVVVLGNDSGHQFTDTQALIDFGFRLYQTVPVINSSNFDFEQTLPVRQTMVADTLEVGQVRIAPENNLLLSLPATFQAGEVELVLNTQDYLMAPVAAGQVVGRVSAVYHGRELGWVNLVTTVGFEQVGAPSTASIAMETDIEASPAYPLGPVYLDWLLSQVNLANLMLILLMVVGLAGLVVIVRLLHWQRRKKRQAAHHYRGGHVIGLHHNRPLNRDGKQNGRHPTRYRYK